MRKNTRRKKRDSGANQRQLTAIIFVVVFVSIWQTLFPPTPPVRVPLSEQQTTDAQRQDRVKLSQLNVDQIASQVRPVLIKGATAKSVAPAAILHTLKADNRFEVTLDSHGEIAQWSVLEDQYRRIIKPAATDTQQEEPRREPYILTTSQPKLNSEGKLSSPFLSPLVQVWVNDELTQGSYTLASGATPLEVKLSLVTSQVEITRHFKLSPDNYRIASSVSVKNRSGSAISVELRAVTRALQDQTESDGGMFTPPLNLLESVCDHTDDFERDGVTSVKSKVQDKEPVRFGQARWFGVDSRYFMSAISAEGTDKFCEQASDEKRLYLNTSIPRGYSPLSTEGTLYKNIINPENSVERSVTFYGGPKQIENLNNDVIDLGNAIDFGIFSPFCIPMLWAMGMFYSFIANWGIAIILLTVLVKLLTFRLTLKQYKSMAMMKVLQPELAVIKEQHKDDPMRTQQETMALYKKHGVSPLSGCLPMLVMMPIYFSLYRTIYSAVELYQAPFFGWLNDLSQPDPYFITPVLLALLMLVQSRMQPTNTSMDPTQRRLLTVFMPLFFGAMMLFLPSGLVLYILVNTVLGLVQQRWSQQQTEAA